MLDTETKRRIDTARDILVGKVPDPKSQVEQITIALIYKFMDDMDAESEELGGKRKFFAGEFAKYGWAKLMRSGLGGHETLNLYSESIAKMPENPGIPKLFRDIFKNAYLPYRDPETLRAFLKIIDDFEYDHSERLGDAYEYLLSVLGSQGDAGQFRTPRHIIDFMVKIVDPKKTESVLDPACGTAGFLISSFKHIMQANTDENGNSTLTPDEKGKLASNFTGYDISPDMVRLSLVNMYLHGFAAPNIHEYDTLTNLDRWSEYADVILANPPFMSPKGGIIPHKRFSMQCKRSEVLFVDYMAEHLTPSGRAGIIVPEGVIFQGGAAYKQLRKMLVEDYLVAVVSLPAGVFNPYSGVKTSILILDKSLAKLTNTIGFFKIENDGTDLGARRKSVTNGDLERAYIEVAEYLGRLRDRASVSDFKPTLGLLVQKEKVAANGEYNLIMERYRIGATLLKNSHPCTLLGGLLQEVSKRVGKTKLPVWSVSNTLGLVHSKEYFDKQVASEVIDNYKVVQRGHFAYNPSRVNVGSIALNTTDNIGAVSPMYVVFNVSDERLDCSFLFALLKSDQMLTEFRRLAHGGVRQQVRFRDLAEVEIPLPPLEVQKEIVAEMEGYQKVIDGARAVVEDYKPHIPVDPAWPMVELSRIIARLESGVSVNSSNRASAIGEIGVLKTSCVTSGVFAPEENKAVLPQEVSRVKCPVRGDSIIISRMNTEALVGANAYVDRDYDNLFLPDRLWQAVITSSAFKTRYIQHVIASDVYRSRISAMCGGTSGSMKNIAKPQLLSLTLPIPPLATQSGIVAEIEAEQALVNANRELITRLEKKIQDVLARVWGEKA